MSVDSSAASRNRRGMTVIEAVIAGALMIALGGSVVAVLAQYQSHYSASWSQLEDRRRAAGALDAVERVVRSSYRARIFVSRADATPSSSGACLQLTRAGVTPAQDVTSYVYATAGGRLVLETPASTTTLCPNVTTLVFSGPAPLVDVDFTVSSPVSRSARVPYRLHSSVETRG